MTSKSQSNCTYILSCVYVYGLLILNFLTVTDIYVHEYLQRATVCLIPSLFWHHSSSTHLILPKAPASCNGQLSLSPFVLSYSFFWTTHLLFLLTRFLSCEVNQLFLQTPISSFMFIFNESPSPSEICPIFISVIS